MEAANNFTDANNSTSIDTVVLAKPDAYVQNQMFLIFFSITGVVALFDNFMIVYIVGSNKKMQNFVHILLASMAVADFLCAFTYFTGLIVCSDAVISGTGSNVWCLANKTVWLITFQVSSVTMFVVALDRFVAVYFPFYHIKKVNQHPIRRVTKAIIVIWLAGTLLVVFAYPKMAYKRFFTPNGNLIHCELAKSINIFRLRTEASQNVLLIIANLTHFWVPFLIISVVYGAIGMKIWRRKLDATTSLGQKDTILMQKWRTIRMTSVTVVVFIICWLPFFIVNIYYFAQGNLHKRPCTESAPFVLVLWLAFSSCCWNPIIYWMYNETYRKGFTDLLEIFRKKPKHDADVRNRPKRISTISSQIQK